MWEVRVSRRTYRVFHFSMFVLALTFGTVLLISDVGHEGFRQVGIVVGFLWAAIAAADFVRAWRETEDQ